MSGAEEIAQAQAEVDNADADIRQALEELSHTELVDRALGLFWEATQLRARLRVQQARNDSLREVLDGYRKDR